MLKINWLLTCLFLFCVFAISAQNISFTSIVSEKNFGESLVGVNVYFNGTITDKDGTFCIKNVTVGTSEVIVLCMSCHCLKEQIPLSGAEIKSNLNI